MSSKQRTVLSKRANLARDLNPARPADRMKLFPEASVLNSVAAFHRLFRVPVLDTPRIPPVARSSLRVALLQEELDELKAAIEADDLVEVADALADLQYVLAGAVHEFGMGRRFAAAFVEVHRSNMSKVTSPAPDPRP
jgi:predicted HAD superfamily Cof-like phosphohydrolase